MAFKYLSVRVNLFNWVLELIPSTESNFGNAWLSSAWTSLGPTGDLDPNSYEKTRTELKGKHANIQHPIDFGSRTKSYFSSMNDVMKSEMEAIFHELPSGLLFPISNNSDGFWKSSVFGKGSLRATKHPNSPNVAFFHRPKNTHLASKSIRSVKCPSCISPRFQLQHRVSMGH